MRKEAGFALAELLISLLVLTLAFALSAQILMEGAQMLADAAAEQTDAPMPLVLARLRGDVRASASFQVLPVAGGPALLLEGHPAGTILYERVGSELRRTVLDASGEILGEAVALRNLTGWDCGPAAPGLLSVTLTHRRSALRRGPLPSLPVRRGPRTEERTESILAAPRGAGLGDGW